MRTARTGCRPIWASPTPSRQRWPRRNKGRRGWIAGGDSGSGVLITLIGNLTWSDQALSSAPSSWGFRRVKARIRRELHETARRLDHELVELAGEMREMRDEFYRYRFI